MTKGSTGDIKSIQNNELFYYYTYLYGARYAL